jgi:hypothetical protein
MLSVLDRLRKSNEELDADEGLIMERDEVVAATTEMLTQALDPTTNAACLKKVLNSLLAFVEEALTTDTVPIVPVCLNKFKFGAEMSPMARRHLKRMHEYVWLLKMLPGMYEFDPFIETFRHSYAKVKHEDQQILTCPDKSSLWQREPLTDSSRKTMVAFNRFVSVLRETGKEIKARKAHRKMLVDAKARCVNFTDYVTSLIQCYRRLVVVRVDLAYKCSLQSYVPFPEMKADFARMMDNARRNDTVFKGKVGFVVKFEFGLLKGPHAHLILFYDGDVRDGRRHSHLAESVGQYWASTITEGQGLYYNSHRDYQELENRGICGIGIVRQSDDLRIANLLYRVLGYLCKSNSYVRPKGGGKMRLMQKGEKPTLKPKKRGRPKKVAYVPSLRVRDVFWRPRRGSGWARLIPQATKQVAQGAAAPTRT